VCGVLLADEGARGESPFAGLDVERVFAAVELLAERDSLEASPFVAAWLKRCRRGTTDTAYIEPGSPRQNVYVESFDSRLPGELLNAELLTCL
jgi:hypothetical protein